MSYFCDWSISCLRSKIEPDGSNVVPVGAAAVGIFR